MTSSRRTFSTTVKIAIFVGLLACWFIYVWYKRHQFDNNFKITTGTINGVTKSGWKGSGRGIEYEYYVDGKKYSGEGGAKTCDTYSLLDLSSLLANKSFPVAYDSTNEGSSIMVLSVKHAKRFNIKITDTLLHYDSIITCEKVFGTLSKY